MTLAGNEWTPITDDDLFAEAIPPKREGVPIKDWPKRPDPVYTMDDWRIFHYWISQKGVSIDFAAQCAGIRVYDALVSLEKRDPWFYEFAVLIGPGSSSRNATKRRRGRGLSMGFGGQIKDYERDTSGEQNYTARPQHRSSSPPAGSEGKLSVEEAQRRFEILLGERNINERVDGQPETVRQFRRGVHDPNGTTPREQPQRTLTLNSRRCRGCGKPGHDVRTCENDPISDDRQG